MANETPMNLEFSGMKLKLVNAGEFTDESGNLRAYGDSIKLQFPGDEYPKKILPSQLAGLVQACADPELKKELNRRLSDEKRIMQGVSF